MADIEVLLEARDIVVGYGGTPVVKGASVAAAAGAVTVIVGPNGAGKSTLLKAIARELPLHSGSLNLGAYDFSAQSAYRLARLGIAYVPQSKNVFPSLTIRENLAIGGYSFKKLRGERLARVFELFPALEAAASRSAWSLSGGEQRMLALGRALMANPKLLLLDEPTAGLSPKMEAIVWEHIMRIKELDVAILVVEQNTRRALSYSDYGYVLAYGEVKMAGTGDELLSNAELVDLYIGKASTFSDGTHDGKTGGVL